jgi:hypothetical protein
MREAVSGWLNTRSNAAVLSQTFICLVSLKKR